MEGVKSMNLRKLGLAGIAAVLTVIGTAAPAASNVAIERFGRVFGYSVCGRTALVGTATCHAKVVTDSRGTILNGKPNALSPMATPAGYGPADIHGAYNLGAVATGSTVPTGPLVAIVDAFGYTAAEADLATYRTQYGLPPCTRANGCLSIVDQNGGNKLPRQDTGWAQEQALDLDMVSATCPTCRILLVQTASNSLANLGTGVNTAARLGAVAISNSYGGSEYSGETSDEVTYYKHPGIAVTVSTGDNGYGSAFPAASQYVTAVGGTSLTKSGGSYSETAWSGAGSGCSPYVAKPSWQSSITACGSKRAIADVSAVADPQTGVAVYGPMTRRSGRKAALRVGRAEFLRGQCRVDSPVRKPAYSRERWARNLAGSGIRSTIG